MVFMIKLPPALAMTTPGESNDKNDRMSLLKSLHRPYGQMDNGDDRYGHREQSPQKSPCPSRQKIVMVAALVIGAFLVLFLVFVTTFGKVPSEAADSFSSGDVSNEKISSAPRVEVKTNCGHLVGKIEDGAFVFKGIPYAKPPVGRLRWRKPVPLWIDHNWCEEHKKQNAYEFGSACFQLNPYNKQYEGREDCLYLNVWTPRLDISKGSVEVMVWIHGGFLQFGKGHEPGISPSARLAKKLDVVFVSLNYRLYTLGFMALDLLADNVLTDSQGNYGLWDQLVALQWVKDNVKSFGGDPKKVTVFGPDSGAASILALMTSSKAQGLFRSVWLIGPTLVFNKTFSEVSAHNRGMFLFRTGCTDAKCIRKAQSKDVITAHLGKDDPSFRIRDQNDLPIQGIFPEQLIVIDGELLRASPSEVLEEKEGKGIPVLLGTAAQAVDFWPGPDDLSGWTWTQYKKYVTTSLDSFGPAVSKMALNIYNTTAAQTNNPHLTAEYLYTTMVSDVRQTCPVNELALQLSTFSQSPVYRYILKSTPSRSAKIYDYAATYSFHLWEVIAFFDQLELFLEEPNEEDFAFRDTVHKTVMTFVRSGGQEIGDSEWLRYSKKTALLSQNITFTDINKTECKFWSQNGLGIYAWVS